jgi:F-type H+-transporting ATPase subunit b
MLLEPEIWVAIGFVVFVGVLGYIGVHKMLAKALDDRGNRIKAELDEAARLKNEALALVAEYRRKREAAESEAQSIIAGAKADAERMATEARAKAEEFVARRTKMAETKIAQAEAQAIADVRNAAADAAVTAAERLLREQATGEVARDLIAKGIADIGKKLN